MLNMMCSSQVLLRGDIILLSTSGAYTNIGMKFNKIHLLQRPLLGKRGDSEIP